jgi:hypothetical protein
LKNLKLSRFYINKLGFLSLFIVPLNQSPQWQELNFNKIKANHVEYSQEKIKISVTESASPLIYSFDSKKKITAFEVTAHVSENYPQIPSQKVQGHKGFDDYVLRFGLIITGNKKMSWLNRLSAPEWLLKMEKLLPEDQGINEVLFFTTCQNSNQLNKTKTHSLSSLLKETCIEHLTKSGSFTLKKDLPEPLEAVGLWISTDGDETKSTFQLEINKIKLNYM